MITKMKSRNWQRNRKLTLSLLALCASNLLLPSTYGQRIFLENFEGLSLGPNVDEAVAGTKVWTETPPAGWTVDDSKMPGGAHPARDGMTEWHGWAFAKRLWWIRADTQRREEFLLGEGTVMIADPDEWDDAAHEVGFYESIVTTGSIGVTNQAANSLVLVYDSSWRPEATDDGAPSFPEGPDAVRINDQTGYITMSVNGATAAEIQRWTSISETPTFHDHFPNETVIVPLNNPANATNLVLRIGMEKAANDWWWALDNIAIGAPPFAYGISADGVGFTARIVEALGKSVDQSRPIVVELDGAAVTPVEVTKEGDLISLKHLRDPQIFVPGSRHTVKVRFTNNSGTAQEDTLEFIAPSYMSARAGAAKITATLQEAEWLTIDESKGIAFQLDGTNITTTALTRADTVITALFSVPQPFVGNSEHTLKAVFTTVSGQVVEESASFTAPVYGVLSASLSTPLGSGSQPGLKWRTHQTETARAAVIADAEAQLRGELGVSVHDITGQEADGYFAIDYVNFEQDAAEAGNFKASGEAPLNVADVLIPGIAAAADRITGEALTFLEIPQPGLYTMVVNSDDGFQVSTGPTNNLTQMVLGKWDSGRGAADSEFYFEAAQAGVYPFRLLWFEGTGGASVEWFTVNSDGSRALIGGTQPGALKAFRVRTGTPAEAPPALSVTRTGSNVALSWPVVSGFQLETTDRIGGTWAAVPTTPVVQIGNNTVQVSLGAGNSFYRLRKP